MGKEKDKIIYVVGSKQFFGSGIRKKGGVLDIEDLYKNWKAWFDRYHYFLNEKKQTSKARPEGKEMEVKWDAFRNITDYVRFHVQVHLWLRRVNDVMVEVNGEKKKMQQADFDIRFKGYFEKNYRGTWKNEFFRRLYDRFIIKKRLLKLEGKIWYETNNLIDETKKYIQVMRP